MIDELFINLSRLQFASTALYHFLFVPLTLGLSWILVIMEIMYVKTGKDIYRDMTKFWGKLFGINFAIGVTTGLTMEFEFGTNWSYYSHYVGDVFGAPLAIEGLMAFFLESTFVGLFFLGWDKLNRKQHLLATFLAALGSNFSALWILVANGWMQHPVGAEFSAQTMRMEMTDFLALVSNPVAQVKFVHTVTAGYLFSAIFVMGVSSFYMLRKRDVEFAKKSFATAVGFAAIAIFGVIILGDESGYTMGKTQQAKLAALEGEYKTEKAPAALNLIGWPNDQKREVEYAIKVPGALGIIATRSTTKEVKGLDDIVKESEQRIISGIRAYRYMMKIREGDTSAQTQKVFNQYKPDLGYALLLNRYAKTPLDATPDDIKEAAKDAVPASWPLFWSFRIMVGIGFAMLFVVFAGFYFVKRNTIEKKRWYLWVSLLSIPLPLIAIEMGWILAEYGRQPWAIADVLPTFMATSSLTTADMIFSLGGFLTFYTILFCVEMFLMFKFARLGPSSLHTGKYHFEKK